MRDTDWLWSRPIAHRGLYDEGAGRPENSLPAFRHALSRGVPFELDVQLTRDGLLVVAHDAELSRVTGERLPVADLDRDRHQRLRLSSSSERIPLLGQVLEMVNGQVEIVIDVRRWTPALRPDLERAVANEIRGYRGDLAFQSFDPVAVLRLRRLVGDYPVGQVSGALTSAGPIAGAIGRTMITNVVARPDFISYQLDLLPSRYAAYWQSRGLPLIAFTVGSSAEEDRAHELADNFFFADYLPKAHRGVAALP